MGIPLANWTEFILDSIQFSVLRSESVFLWLKAHETLDRAKKLLQALSSVQGSTEASNAGSDRFANPD